MKNPLILLIIAFVLLSCGAGGRRWATASKGSPMQDALRDLFRSDMTADDAHDTRILYIDTVLTPENVNLIRSVQHRENDEYDRYEYGDILDKYLRVELIDKEVYERAMTKKVDHFTPDDTNPRTVDGVTTIVTDSMAIILRDNPTDGDDMCYYSYLGQYGSLNQYVVGLQGWEYWRYSFYDKTTGREQVFEEFPYVSPDEKHIITVYSSLYEGEETTDVNLYRLTQDGQAELIVSVDYLEWGEESHVFWASDGCFYLKAHRFAGYYTDEGVLHEYYGGDYYLRITLLD